MSSIPTPKSYNQVVSDMVSSFLSRVGIPSLRVGSPILSIIEAAAQSDVRSSHDVFSLLNSISLDRATGLALDRIGADEEVNRTPESSASGLVTISDTSFDKVSTKIYQGSAAPIIGSASINVNYDEGADLPSTGDVYVGRGTTNYEGPLEYTSKTDNVSYWTLNLGAGSETQKFHNVGETVILAQGGDRIVAAGTIVQTPQGNTSSAVQFATLYSSTIPDGETYVSSVTVVARTPGVTGNVPAGSINSFVTAPFVGATVTNPSPFANGQAIEDDKTYRERIRNTRASRSRGTPLAIKTAVNGIISTDENKRVLSSSVVTRQGYPTTLYIDDGTGYEEISEGIAYEVLADNAVGGEQYFQLSEGRPVTQAYALTSISAPFALENSSYLAVMVGGIRYEHQFDEQNFVAIGNASAYEVAASINGDSTVAFSARTYANGTKVAIFADEEPNEDIEVVEPNVGTDANTVLGFPAGRNDTIRLYRNDVLLSKDGKIATLTSTEQGDWGTIATGADLDLVVDGVDVSSILSNFSDQDFIDAGTGFTTVSESNTLQSWVDVFNYKIPGVTAVESNGTIVLSSNLGRDSRASLSITGGSLVSSGMFAIDSSTGEDNDYTLDRNLGQIRLNTNQVLEEGDKLSVGSLYTRGFLESDEITTADLASSGILWFCVDGGATIIETGLSSGAIITSTVAATVSGVDRVRLTAASAVFDNVEAGDWLINTDSGFGAADLGAYRIANVDAGFLYIDVEHPSAYVATGANTISSNDFIIVRSSTQPDKVTIATGNDYTATSFVTSLNTQLDNAVASTYKTNKIRIRTKTFGDNGDIMLVSANEEGQKLLLPEQTLVSNLTPHLASVESGNSEAGTPSFTMNSVSSVTSDTLFSVASLGSITSGSMLVVEKFTEDAGPLGRYGNEGHRTPLELINVLALTVRDAPVSGNATEFRWLPGDRFYPASPFAIGPEDNLTMLLDRDSESKRFSIPMYRKCTPKPGDTYGITTILRDADYLTSGSPSGFGTSFGDSFDWKDFALYMKARAKSLTGDKQIFWRYYRHGPEGNNARLAFVYPTAAASAVAVTTDNTSNKYSNIHVRLPSGTARSGYVVRNSTKIGVSVTANAGGYDTLQYVFHLLTTSASRTGSVVSLLAITAPGGSAHGLSIGDAIYVKYGAAGNGAGFVDGAKVITGTGPVTYAEAGADIGVTAIAGTVSVDSAGEVTTSGGSIIVGDILSVTSASSLPAGFERATKLASVSDDRVTSQYPGATGGTPTAVVWYAINSTANISFYPLDNNSAAEIATAVTALSDCPVAAQALVAAGAGLIENATYESAVTDDTSYYYHLSDGINWIRSTSYAAPDYTFTLKDAVTAGLSTNNDWENEDVRLVPITATNISNYLEANAVTGLSAGAEIATSTAGGKVQIASDSPGYEGSVQIQGGTANSVSATCRSSAISITDTDKYMSVSVNSSDVGGLRGNMWCRIENAISVPKTVFTSATTLVGIIGSEIEIGVTDAWNFANASLAAITGLRWQVEKQGNFVAWVYLSGGAPNLSGLENDWVTITGTTNNNGTFRVIRADNTAKVFWIENPNAEETSGTATLKFTTYDSVMPGDTLVVNTNAWGVANVGTYTVSAIHATNTKKFSVTPAFPDSGATAGALGTESSLIQVFEAQPSSLIRKIRTMGINNDDADLTDIMFDQLATVDTGYEKVGVFAGSIIKPLDKLAFGVTEASGLDGYEHSTGLIAEANRVCYGDEANPTSYPGVVAAGATINISGPLVKRVQVSLSIRARTGVSISDIEDKVKSAVASVINNTGIGESIAISSVISAASAINGVISVAIVSPEFSTTNDLISTQPYEKPLVLNVDQDIDVSFVGE